MRLPSKSTTFWILMAVSAAAVVLIPKSWTSGLRGLFQPLAFLQWPASSAARQTEQAVARVTSKGLSAAEAEALRAENQRLLAQVVNQQQALDELREKWAAMKALSAELPDSHVTLLLAPVISYDADPRHESLQIALNERTRKLVRTGQWVAAGVLQAPTSEMLRRQWLIGRVIDVQTQLARVELTTDPKFRTEVRVGRLRDDGTGRYIVDLAPEGCILDGQGAGRMLISQAVADYPAGGYNLVVAAVQQDLPEALIIGQITGSKRRSDSSQHFDLSVTPWGSALRLTHVVVIATPGER